MNDEHKPSGPGSFVTEAYRLEERSSMLSFYDKWARDYDNQMEGGLGYCSPRLVAELLMKFLQNTSAKILDVGCGTGLTSRSLYEADYRDLHGLDLSPAMVDVAEKTGMYRGLKVADVNEPLDYDSDSFDAVICSGTFTHGHVGPKPLVEIVRVVKPKGLIACTVQVDLWTSAGFKEMFAELESKQRVRALHLAMDRYYESGEPEGWFCVYEVS